MAGRDLDRWRTKSNRRASIRRARWVGASFPTAVAASPGTMPDAYPSEIRGASLFVSAQTLVAPPDGGRPESLRQGLRDRVEERLHAEGNVLNPAVEEERGRRAHAALDPALLLLADALQVNRVLHLRRVARHVQLEALGVFVQVVPLQGVLVLEQKVMHRPE